MPPPKAPLSQDALHQVRSFLQEDIKLAVSQAVSQSVQAFEKLQKVSSDNFNKTFLSEMRGLKESIEALNIKHRDEMNDIRSIIEGETLSTEQQIAIRIVSLTKDFHNYIDNASAREKCQTMLNDYVLSQLAHREQRDRLWSIRVNNVQCPWLEKTPTSHEVFNIIIKPVLQAQNPEKDIHYDNTIEYSHPLSQRVKGPRNYIFRFYSRHLLFSFMINKRRHLQSIDQRARDKTQWCSSAAVSFDGKKFIKCSHDLADTNRSLMTYLHSCGLASKTKLSGTSVAFMPADGPQKWVKVLNSMARSHIGLITPLPPLKDIIETDNLIVKFMRENGQSNKDVFFKGFESEIKSLLQDLKANKLPSIQIERDNEDQPTMDPIGVTNADTAEFPALPDSGAAVPAPSKSRTAPASGTATAATAPTGTTTSTTTTVSTRSTASKN